MLPKVPENDHAEWDPQMQRDKQVMENEPDIMLGDQEQKRSVMPEEIQPDNNRNMRVVIGVVGAVNPEHPT